MNAAHYDAVVIGSGFGGSLVAHALVQAGLKTALLERGQWAKRDDADWDQRTILLKKRYRSASPLLVKQYGRRTFQRTYPNEVVGGNSVFFGGASLRLRPADFARWPFLLRRPSPVLRPRRAAFRGPRRSRHRSARTAGTNRVPTCHR